ncbi:MAG: iron-containing alcohol dehydrogenase [Candidatus Wallbacteria bacterium]|nr:iron-containing alcohol dehydrogenase [Candidatus Wallbacteria bacterium]
MEFPDFFQFHLPTRIVFGKGLSADFSAELAELKVTRAFLVTEKFLHTLGIPERVMTALQAAGVAVAGCFDEVVPNSEVALCERGAELARKAGADCVVAVGGGSSIDTAKAIALLLSEGGRLLDYQGAQTLTRPLKPMVAIPTTAGTGSEVTMVAVINDPESESKISLVDRFLTPALAVLDPELTLTLPKRITAATGMDALTHAVEAYVDIESSPFSDALAAQAIRLVSKLLLAAVTEGGDVEVRSGMQIASTLAGVAFNHSMVGVVHGMAHALGGMCHVVHGEANAMMLPFGMEYNLDARERKFAEVARFMGIDTRGLSERDAALAGIDHVRQLNQKLHELAGLPTALSQVGVPRDKLASVAGLAMTDGSMFYNPREVVEDEVLGMLERAH